VDHLKGSLTEQCSYEMSSLVDLANGPTIVSAPEGLDRPARAAASNSRNYDSASKSFVATWKASYNTQRRVDGVVSRQPGLFATDSQILGPTPQLSLGALEPAPFCKFCTKESPVDYDGLGGASADANPVQSCLQDWLAPTARCAKVPKFAPYRAYLSCDDALQQCGDKYKHALVTCKPSESIFNPAYQPAICRKPVTLATTEAQCVQSTTEAFRSQYLVSSFTDSAAEIAAVGPAYTEYATQAPCPLEFNQWPNEVTQCRAWEGGACFLYKQAEAETDGSCDETATGGDSEAGEQERCADLGATECATDTKCTHTPPGTAEEVCQREYGSAAAYGQLPPAPTTDTLFEYTRAVAGKSSTATPAHGNELDHSITLPSRVGRSPECSGAWRDFVDPYAADTAWTSDAKALRESCMSIFDRWGLLSQKEYLLHGIFSQITTNSEQHMVLAKRSCVGQWGACTALCKKTFAITAFGGVLGDKCEAEDGEVQDCDAGADQCPQSCVGLITTVAGEPLVNGVPYTSTRCSNTLQHNGICTWSNSNDGTCGTIACAAGAATNTPASSC
jgi:hypothetical protein